MSDEVCLSWNGSLIMNYKERLSILNSLGCVNTVIKQNSIDPTDNIKKYTMTILTLK